MGLVEFWRKAIALRPGVLLLVIFAFAAAFAINKTRPAFHGDAAEYTLMTISIAEHGSAETRPSDVQLARKLLPEFAWHHDGLQAHFENGSQLPPGFLKGVDGKVHAIHSFGYSAVAAIPFKVLQVLGRNPMKCFLWVDAVSLLLLAYAAYLYFDSLKRALLTVALLVSTVGYPYWNWASPELFSTALSLSALLLMARAIYLPAGMLIGLAGMQNPPLLALLFLGPLIVLACQAPSERKLSWRMALGAAAGVAIGLSPIYFSFQFFGTWNVIASGATDPRLVSLLRLVSYYIDLNQGMLIAIPAVWLFIGFTVLRERKLALLLLPVMLASLVLAVPALSTQNWNSGASGMMRYVVWGSVPFLFFLLAAAKRFERPSAYLVGLFFVLQAPFAAHATMYSHMEFSPLAKWVLQHAPQLYNPEPEIFVDRSTRSEPMLDFDKTYTFGAGDKQKTLYYAGSLKGMSELCPHSHPVAKSVDRASYDGWTYLTGQAQCDRSAISIQSLGIAELSQGAGGKIEAGWSRPEFGRPEESGIWSVGKESTFKLSLPEGRLDAITIQGNYMRGNVSTEVLIDGKPVGSWHLDRPNRIVLDARAPARQLEITLRHASPQQPSPQDTRALAFFLKRVSIQSTAQRGESG